MNDYKSMNNNMNNLYRLILTIYKRNYLNEGLDTHGRIFHDTLIQSHHWALYNNNKIDIIIKLI